MIEFAIEKAFMKKNKYGWGKYPELYWAIDLHDVIIPGSYTKNNDGKVLYENSKEVLRWLTGRKDMYLILWTASHIKPSIDITKWLFEEHGVIINSIGTNPECPSTDLCDFTNKLYFDILLEDKAGFNGERDWIKIKRTLQGLGEWDKKHSHEEILTGKTETPV